MCKFEHRPEKVIKEGESVFDEIENLDIIIKQIILDLKAIQELIVENDEMIREINKKLGELDGEA